MDKPKMYRVTSPLDLYLPFTKGLLTAEQKKDWEQFKLDEVKGRSEEEIRNLKRDVESTRLQRWATAMGLGADPIQQAMKKGDKPEIPFNYIPVNRFVIPQGETIVTEEIYNEIKKYQVKEIKQKLQPGEVKAKIVKEGFLTIEPLSEEEITELNNKKKK